MAEPEPLPGPGPGPAAWIAASSDELPAPPGFVPLGLTLLPSGFKLTVTSPDIIVGRHSQCDVCLPLPDVSRRHCRLYFSDQAWHISDLASRNGTHVNGAPIDHATLRASDRVCIGGFTFVVQAQGDSDTLAPRNSTGLNADQSGTGQKAA